MGDTTYPRMLEILTTAFDLFEGGKKWGRGTYRSHVTNCMCSGGAIACALNPDVYGPLDLNVDQRREYQDVMRTLAVHGFHVDANTMYGHEDVVYSNNDAAEDFGQVRQAWVSAIDTVRAGIATPAVQS